MDDLVFLSRIYPSNNDETRERAKLLISENAPVRVEPGSLKDRLATIGRKLTDGAYRPDREIGGLRGRAN